ncbi:hypothetical protein BDF22DRAFT_653233 [Syncephalis plumigaleata]|nr:hypothetical protein BDF22DRAFT_653233 [Syncephalis plumigaleata]
MVGERDKAAFDALMAARITLKGANEEYRNYVKYPLKYIEVPAGPSRPAGNCFVYRNIGGMTTLGNLIRQQNYADKLITLSQVIPQLLKDIFVMHKIWTIEGSNI